MKLARILNHFRKSRDDSAPDTRKGWLSFSASDYRNDPQWFQKGFDPPTGNSVLEVSTVYACVKIISEELARLNIGHWVTGPKGGRRESLQSAAALVLRNPNRYQTRSDFILYLALQLLTSGNAYALAVRDLRGAIKELHPLPGRSCTPYVVPDTGEIFYHFTSFDLTHAQYESGTMVPQRDVLHLRLFTPTHPLIGQAPIVAAAMAMLTQQSINGQSAEFFANMSRPSGLLTTPKPLPQQAAARLKAAWEQARQGKTPILDNDIKYQQLTLTAVEADLIRQFNLSVKQIASVYRVPLDFLGEMENATFSNVEQLQKRFIMSTLGFYLEHLECAFDKFFGLPPTEHIKFDLESGMMRPDFGDRMGALSKGVTGGVLTPDEARARENLEPVEGGDRIFMQRQNWPIDMLGADAVPAVQDPVQPSAEGDDPDEDSEDEKTIDLALVKYLERRTQEKLSA